MVPEILHLYLFYKIISQEGKLSSKIIFLTINKVIPHRLLCRTNVMTTIDQASLSRGLILRNIKDFTAKLTREKQKPLVLSVVRLNIWPITGNV